MFDGYAERLRVGGDMPGMPKPALGIAKSRPQNADKHLAIQIFLCNFAPIKATTIMDIESFLHASRLAIMALALSVSFCFTSCGGDDEEPLSNETTSIEFEYRDFYLYSPKVYCMFDYAGSKYIGSDTISASKCTQELRNGKHQLVWVKGLDDSGNPKGVHFDTRKKAVTTSNEYGYVSDEISFCMKDIEVSQGLAPYLTTPLQIKCTESLTCNLTIYVTDLPEGFDNVDSGWSGKLTGVPFVKTVSLTDRDYELKNEDYGIGISIDYGPTRDDIAVHVDQVQMLCPLEGIDNIQLKAEVQDGKDRSVKTVPLPSFSLQRGKMTTLTGPLFSGTTGDWRVEIHPMP